MKHTPFYDPGKTYDQNYEGGPFGEFARPHQARKFSREPRYEFLGYKINLPFGIPAGPLINSKFAKSAFEMGFDVNVYKTVRSTFYPCHPFPNVLAVRVDGDLTLEKAKEKLVADTNFFPPLSITNSFGVPSKYPQTWQEDVRKALSYQQVGQLLILSFMGTVRENQSQDEFVQDYILTAKLSMETGVHALEVNLSCPNIGNEGLVCYNLEATERICDGIRNVIGNIPLVLKIGYFQDDNQLFRIAEIANKYADAIAAINTIQAEIVDKQGNQVLPGVMRSKSGICGAGIRWAGLDMTKRLADIRKNNNFDFEIIGVGGVMTPQDYFEYRKEGADLVQSATGAMWNPFLAWEIAERVYGAFERIENVQV